MKFFASVFVAAAITAFPAYAEIDVQGTNLFRSLFHEPKSTSEKTLDFFITQIQIDENFADNLFEGRGNKNYKQTFNYHLFLTDKLIDDLRAREAYLVKEYCHGHYNEHEVCGFDANPITCAQDDLTNILYYSFNDNGFVADILIRRKNDFTIHAEYFLTRPNQHAKWKISQIRCFH